MSAELIDTINAIARQPGEYVCPIDGTPVEPNRHGGMPKIYCSSRCKEEARRRRNGILARPNRGAPPKGQASRRPLPEFARMTGWELRRNAEKLQRILADDRLSEHKTQVAAQLRGHLDYTLGVCLSAIERLTPQEGK